MICDFGSARMYTPTHSLAKITSTVKGTTSYLAPELIDDINPSKHSKNSDVWALGMTIFVSFFAVSLVSLTAHRIAFIQ
jgi:serine/threonine protein kinase